nr:MAG: hypothetical protein [Lake Baikal virophage 9]
MILEHDRKRQHEARNLDHQKQEVGEWMQFKLLFDNACDICDIKFTRGDDDNQNIFVPKMFQKKDDDGDEVLRWGFVAVCMACNETYPEHVIPYVLTTAYTSQRSVKISEDHNVVKLI